MHMTSNDLEEDLRLCGDPPCVRRVKLQPQYTLIRRVILVIDLQWPKKEIPFFILLTLDFEPIR
jgi:hypothetical protein